VPPILWLIPGLPLFGFVALYLSAGRMPHRAAAAIGVGSIGLATLLAFAFAHWFLGASLPGDVYLETAWRWITIGGFDPAVAFRLDPLSLVMMLVVTFVGFLIHLYSAEFMAKDEGYGRFFAYMNLFVAAMLTLVLADNLLVLYAGWEGVGLASYLLIGFWYRDPANGAAARKAFILTRIGDTAFIIGLFLLFHELGTLDIATLMARAHETWATGSAVANAAAALLLAGALGKSAQLPLQTWLPDAMAGPTPVSALLHAATMVTAGVYLIARTHELFELAPAVEFTVAVIGAATLLLAACSALNQHDIKRILAYSTMSQIGYMFLALGVGAWTAAIFHFMTHAFFKALLFLAAGAVMMRLNDEHDIFRMGGLWRRMPVAFVSFLIGASSLAALPLVTAGFYSKDMILWGVWSSGPAGPGLWATGFVGAFITALYSFRAVFVMFFGDARRTPSGRYGWCIVAPLAVLSALALTGGFVNIPSALGNVNSFSDLLAPVLPARQEVTTASTTQALVMAATSLLVLLGVYLAYLTYIQRAQVLRRIATSSPARALAGFWFGGWGFDTLYEHIFVRPFLALARLNRNDIVDACYGGLVVASRTLNRALSRTVTGRVRAYAAWVAVGSLAALAIALFLQ